MPLRRAEENEVLSHPNGYLPQAGQNVCLVRKVEAKGCGGLFPAGSEIRDVLHVLGRELAALLLRELSAAAPPRGDQQQPQEFGQADRDQRRTALGVGVENWAFLAAFTTEEVRAPSAVAGETLERSTRGEKLLSFRT
ncbi:hypothetical protein ACH4UV_33880 [Streptomyces sp. NPDC020802]|uniref:hypothetical protein n=1 Tax=Streptomyces sp. NPDC020802 TaxID=3365094 RepID=UPI0037968C93